MLRASVFRAILGTIILLPFAVGKGFQQIESWRKTVPWLSGFSLLTRSLDRGSRGLAAIAISAYQRYLSPYKRFSCAHRRLYGGEPCSQYVKRAIAEQGLAAAAPLSQTRFQACRAANLILKAEPTNLPQPDPPQARKRKDQKRRSRSHDNSFRFCSDDDCLLSCFDLSCDGLSAGDCGGDRNQNCLPDGEDCRPDWATDCMSNSTPECIPDDCTPGCDLGDCDLGGCDLGDCSAIDGISDCGAIDCGGCDCG